MTTPFQHRGGDHAMMQTIVTHEIAEKARQLQNQGYLGELAHPDDAFAHFFTILRECYDNLHPSNDYDLDIG